MFFFAIVVMSFVLLRFVYQLFTLIRFILKVWFISLFAFALMSLHSSFYPFWFFLNLVAEMFFSYLFLQFVRSHQINFSQSVCRKNWIFDFQVEKLQERRPLPPIISMCYRILQKQFSFCCVGSLEEICYTNLTLDCRQLIYIKLTSLINMKL